MKKHEKKTWKPLKTHTKQSLKKHEKDYPTVQVNSIITSVRLTHNNIPDEGLAALVECVAARPHVIDLDLRWVLHGVAWCCMVMRCAVLCCRAALFCAVLCRAARRGCT
jgi:hypothetical protein